MARYIVFAALLVGLFFPLHIILAQSSSTSQTNKQKKEQLEQQMSAMRNFFGRRRAEEPVVPLYLDARA